LGPTIESYNERARMGGPDEKGKPVEHLEPVERPPFAAVPVHLDGVLFPAPCITLGGLDVDTTTQRVRRVDGSEIRGLYAVGRCAAGVASRSYVSGLSLADCVFSGRNAGMAIAANSAE
jgi:3-oxo-5alpha-steroid 4-dehydrogenase